MTTVFLSGSRKISQLDETVTSRLSTIVEKGFRVIVGDANGADKAMAGEADYGLVLWNGESPGSISNVIEMLKRSKRVVVYLSSEKQFYAVSHLDDANKLLEKCDKKAFEVISRKIRLSTSMKEIRNSEQGVLSFSMYL